MKPRVLATSSAPEFETAERCHIRELSNSTDDEQVSIARARVEPGVTTALHRLRGIEERYLILEGTGRVEVGGPDLAADVSPGDVVWIPPGVTQRITNTGAIDLVFLCICTPRFDRRCYELMEAGPA
jgi:mannose-6-phosphate isomerase-like protein (cupin superfamily)